MGMITNLSASDILDLRVSVIKKYTFFTCFVLSEGGTVI